MAVTSALLYVLVRNDLARTQQAVAQQRLLARGAEALRAATTPARAWTGLAGVLREGAELDVAQVWLTHDDGGLVLAASDAAPGAKDTEPRSASIAPNDPGLVWLWRQDAVSRLVDLAAAPALGASAGMTTAVVVPVRRPGQLLGAIVLMGPANRAVPTDTLGSASELASLLASTLERFSLEESLQRRALYDDVTGLPNRALLTDRLESALQDGRLTTETFMVLMCDVDQFDTVSQSFGHEEAERLLAAAAQRLESVLGPRDTLSRSQSREFTMIARDVHDADAAALYLERLDAAFAEPVEVAGTVLPLTVSVGVHFAAGEMNGASVLRDAVTALHRARTGGRGGRVFFDPEMRDSVEATLHTEIELRRAIAEHEFELHFQPIIVGDDRSVLGAEALIRWRHPTRGLLLPDAFIGVAEETGLITDIGRQVLRLACQECVRWPEVSRLPLVVSVNLSATEFSDERLTDAVAEALQATGLDPSRLLLEITETAVMAHPDRAYAVIQSLREIGTRVAVDDFGTGYSSLAYLKRFPLDALKVDRVFVSGVPGTGDDATITRAIVEMSHALGLRAIAEGVESEDQALFLAGQGYDAFQGYLFGKPMPAREFEALLAEL